MKIRIGKPESDIALHIPTGLILNRFVLGLALEAAGEKLPVQGSDMTRLLKEIERIRKIRGPWQLVEVHSADGTDVSITL